MSHKWARFVIHPVSQVAASGDSFSKRNLWSGSHNSETGQGPAFRKPSHFCVQEQMCAFISSQGCANRCELRACNLVWLIISITSCKALLCLGNIFWLASVSLRMTQEVDLSRSKIFDRVVKQKSTHSWQPLHPCICWYNVCWSTVTHYVSWYVVIPRLNSSVAVVLAGNKSTSHMSACTSSWRAYHTETSTAVCCPRQQTRQPGLHPTGIP